MKLNFEIQRLIVLAVIVTFLYYMQPKTAAVALSVVTLYTWVRTFSPEGAKSGTGIGAFLLSLATFYLLSKYSYAPIIEQKLYTLTAIAEATGFAVFYSSQERESGDSDITTNRTFAKIAGLIIVYCMVKLTLMTLYPRVFYFRP